MCHGVTLLPADFGCRLQSLHGYLNMVIASLSTVMPDLRLPAAGALRCTGWSARPKTIRLGQESIIHVCLTGQKYCDDC